MGRPSRTAELVAGAVSTVAACGLLLALLAERSDSPILGRVGVAEGEVRNERAATDRVRLANTPSSEPVAHMAPDATLRWTWDEPIAIRAVALEGVADEAYEIALTSADGGTELRSSTGGGGSGFVRRTVRVDGDLVGLSVRAVGPGDHHLSEVSLATRSERPSGWAPILVGLIASPALWIASRRQAAVAVALALGVAWRANAVLGHGVFAQLDGDSVGYLARAMALFTGAPGEALWPPGTHVFFGLLWAIDPTWNALLVAQVVLSSLVAILAGRVAERAGGSSAGALAAAATALWFPLVALTPQLWPQTLFAFLLVASVALVLEGWGVLGGLALGMAVATRSEALLFASVPFVVLARERPSAALRVALGTLLVLVPTAVRATTIAGAPTLVATNPALHVATAWWARVSPDPLARNDAGFDVAWEIVRARPLWALGEGVASAGRAFTDGAATVWSLAAITAALVAGVGTVARKRPQDLVLLWPLAGALVVSAIAVGASRYRVPTDPFTLALAATVVTAFLAEPRLARRPAPHAPSASGASAPPA